MKQLFTLCAVFLLAQVSSAQVASGTGTVSFRMTNAGSLTMSKGSPYVHANREVGRMSIVVAQSQTSVFDYNEDQNSTTVLAHLLTVPGVDSTVEVLTDNSYTNLPPKILVRIRVMGWNNQNYAIVRYTIIADTINLGSMYYAAVVVPRVGAAYGGETVKYNAAKKVGYFYRENEASYWGVKALSPQIFGFRAMDWDEYSPDPDNDLATDSLRNEMTKYSSFDASVVAGSNGSFFSVNSGKSSFNNKGDSAVIYYALGYGETESAMLASLDSATAKFPKIATSVQLRDQAVPNGFSLEQNYPNPFNPSTTIGFSVGTSSFVTLRMYDALGREIRSLVNQNLDAGSYTVPFDARDLSSGVYYYTIQAGSFTSSKKMLLTK